MTILRDLKRLEFAGLPIPYSQLKVRGGLRHHVHEYPHVAGGSLEKLGRKLYEVSATCHFDASSVSGRYSLMWPEGIASFRKIFENGETHPLQLPWIGTIDACALEWDETVDVKIISGESVELKWIEDQESQFLIDAVLATVSTSSMTSAFGTFDASVAAIKPPVSIFETIRSAVNTVLGIRDQGLLYQSLVDAKLQELINLIGEADKTVALLNDPVNYQLLEDLHQLWEATVKLYSDVAQVDLVMDKYTLPRQMRVDEIAAAIYDGATDRASEIMQLNAVEDPYAVPGGKVIRYYKAA